MIIDCEYLILLIWHALRKSARVLHIGYFSFSLLTLDHHVHQNSGANLHMSCCKPLMIHIFIYGILTST